MALIFFFSTDSFSSAHTSGIIEPLLKFVFPFLTPPQLYFWHGVIRKLGHITEYFILAVLAWRMFRIYFYSGFKVRMCVAAFVLAFALSDELHQAFVASRTSSLGDVGYDFLGCLAALMVLPKKLNNEDRRLFSYPIL
jgi:VanZ family protein